MYTHGGVIIYNSIGEEIFNAVGKLSEINKNLRNQMINQPKGVYFLRIQSEQSNFIGETITLKIVIQ